MNHMKHVNTLFRQNVVSLNTKTGDEYNYHCALKYGLDLLTRKFIQNLTITWWL
jgi:hypothetical protein